MSTASASFSPFDYQAMTRALELAKEALTFGEVPVGAVITCAGQILAQAFNLRETLSDPTGHAERLAITLAGRARNSWRLDNCSLYVTLEPCPMCAGAIVQSRLSRVFYGANDPKAGACDSLYRITADRRLNHRAQVQGGLLANDCGALLTRFFQNRRKPPLRSLEGQEPISEECLSGR